MQYHSTQLARPAPTRARAAAPTAWVSMNCLRRSPSKRPRPNVPELDGAYVSPTIACGANTFSLGGKTTCTACQSFSTSSTSASACTCSAGYYSTDGLSTTLPCTGTAPRKRSRSRAHVCVNLDRLTSCTRPVANRLIAQCAPRTRTAPARARRRAPSARTDSTPPARATPRRRAAPVRSLTARAAAGLRGGRDTGQRD